MIVHLKLSGYVLRILLVPEDIHVCQKASQHDLYVRFLLVSCRAKLEYKGLRWIDNPLPESSPGTATFSTMVLPRKSGPLVKSDCLPLKIYRTDIPHIAMTTLAIIEAFNVIEYIGSRFVSCSITPPVNPFAFQ